MAFGKCEKCEQTVRVKQSGKRYILPLFFFFTGLLILALSVITVLGGLSAVSGLIWLCVTGFRYFRS
jgi:hypothetical protein